VNLITTPVRPLSRLGDSRYRRDARFLIAANSPLIRSATRCCAVNNEAMRAKNPSRSHAAKQSANAKLFRMLRNNSNERARASVPSLRKSDRKTRDSRRSPGTATSIRRDNESERAVVSACEATAALLAFFSRAIDSRFRMENAAGYRLEGSPSGNNRLINGRVGNINDSMEFLDAPGLARRTRASKIRTRRD